MICHTLPHWLDNGVQTSRGCVEPTSAHLSPCCAHLRIMESRVHLKQLGRAVALATRPWSVVSAMSPCIVRQVQTP